MYNSVVQAVSFDEFFQLHLLLGTAGNQPGLFFCPSDIAEDHGGELYVADELNHQIHKLSNTGKLLRTFGTKGERPGEFNYPTSLSISHGGDIIVTDRWNHRVQVLSQDGSPALTFGSYGKTSGDFNEPWGLAVSPNGDMLIADRGNHRIQVYDQTGKFQRSFGKPGLNRHYYESAQFKSGYVFERWQGALSRFNPIETTFRHAGYEVGDLEFPRWIPPYRDDIFLVIDAPGAIHLVEARDGFIDQIELNYSDEKGQYCPAAATTMPSGTVLICDEHRNEIIALRPDSDEKILLADIPYPVSNLKFLPSGKLALIHCWSNLISISTPKADL